jgi:hypothetical protein
MSCCASCARGEPCESLSGAGPFAGTPGYGDYPGVGYSPTRPPQGSYSGGYHVVPPEYENPPRKDVMAGSASFYPRRRPGVGQDMFEHRRIGIGDAAAFGAAQRDLATSMGTVVAQGDFSFTAGDYQAAMQSYKNAGAYGAQTLGPEIDAAGAPNVTQPLTQEAWTLNDSQLAHIDPTTNDQNLAQMAQSTAHSMVALYQRAIAAGIAALGQPQPPAPPQPPPQPPAPPQPAQPAQTDYTVPILVGATIIGAGIVGWALYTKRPARHVAAENPVRRRRRRR